MNNFHIAVSAICLLALLGLTVQDSYAQERPFGLGVIIGEPTGLSGKLWRSDRNAFDFALGVGVYRRPGDFHLHADYLWHAWDVVHSTERFPLYYGIGGRYKGSRDEGSIAVRGVFGVAWMPRETPLDFFIELAPSLEVTPATRISIEAAIGARYYF